MRYTIAGPLLIVLTAGCSREPGVQLASGQSAPETGGRGTALSNDGRAASVVLRRVWSGPQVDFLGAPSPDGRQFSLVDWESGDLALRDLATDKLRRVTNKGSWDVSGEFALSSVMSRDGRRIAYTWLNRDLVYELRVIGVDGSGMQTLLSRTYVTPHAWSPDGKQILALLWDDDGTTRIAVVDAKSGATRVLKSLSWKTPLKMDLSPDGRFIAYDLPSDVSMFSRDIHVLAVRGETESQLTRETTDERLLGWSPDGASLLFASNRGGSEGVWLLPVANGRRTGDPVLVRHDVWRVRALGFARHAYFYGVTISQGQIYTAALDPKQNRIISTPTPLTDPSRGDASAAAWSPDGLSIAYVVRVGDLRSPWTVVIRSMRTGETRELAPQLAQVFRMAWAPDGNSLVVTGAGKGRTGAFRVDLKTAEARPIVSMPGPFVPVGPVLSPDGNTLFYFRYRSEDKTLDIIARDLTTDRERVIGPRVSTTQNLVISPDGRQLAFTTADPKTKLHSLAVVAAEGGAARVVHQLAARARFGNFGVGWTPDGKTLFFSASAGPDRKLYKIPVQGGNPELVLDMITGGLRIHPDGRSIAFDSGDWKGEVWVMENLPSAPRTANRKGDQP